jgi:oligosaccharide translocation protein RFT1
LVGSLFAQTIVKHVLTQGDVLLIAVLASLEAQGAYALASNYGGLIARMVFQPIEESSRNYFAKLLSSIERAPPKAAVNTASKQLHTLLRLYVLLSIIATALGPTIAPQLLGIVAGSKWTSSGAGDVLATYCYYIPLLAMNGITEAFVSAVATKSELNRQSAWMLAFSFGFAGAGFVFLQVLDWGAQGLVWANVINMAVRIVWSGNFIAHYLTQHGNSFDITKIMPHPASLAVGVCTSATLSQLQDLFTISFGGIIRSGVAIVSFLFIL